MSRPDQEAIDTFISVTGASEDVAVRKLEEHGGDLNAAVDAHFSESDRTLARAVPGNEMMDMIDMARQQYWDAASSLFSSERGVWDPFPFFGRSLFDRMSGFWSRAPFGFSGLRDWDEPLVSRRREVREIPIEVIDRRNESVPTIEDVTHSSHAYAHEPEIHGTVTFAGEDDG